MAITVEQYFPSIKTIEDSNGLVSANFALVFVQSRYRARMLRRAYLKADVSGDYAAFRQVFKMHQKRIAKESRQGERGDGKRTRGKKKKAEKGKD